MAFRNAILGGDDILVRDKIKSENYVPGVSGWQIERNGNAEFNDVTIRGDVEVGSVTGTQVIITTDSGAGVIKFPTHSTQERQPGEIQSFWNNNGLTDESVTLGFIGPNVQGAQDRIGIDFISQENDGGSEATIRGWRYNDLVPTEILFDVDDNKFQIFTEVRLKALDTLATGSVASSANETVIGTFDPAIDASSAVNQGWEYDFFGSADAGATSPTIVFRVRLDGVAGTQLVAFGAITYLAAGGTNRHFHISGQMAVDVSGAGGRIQHHNRIEHIIAAAGFAQVQDSVGAISVDLTTAHTLVVTADWSAAAAANVARTLTGTIRRTHIA